MRAIIVGSGIAGLSAALALRRVGVGVTLYERAPELSEVGAGISLWANAVRALDHIGAGPAVRAVALPMERSEFRVRDGYRVALPGCGLRAEVRGRALRRDGSPGRVGRRPGRLPAEVGRYGFECVGVEPGGGALVRFKNGHTDEADVVVGADAIRSAVRASLLGPEEPRYAGYTCWRGSARARRPLPRGTPASGGAAGGGSGSPPCRATASTGGRRRTSRPAGGPGTSGGMSPRRSAGGPTRSPNCSPPPRRVRCFATTSWTVHRPSGGRLAGPC
jgi:2-polyprenyl-6-methoxyphenol hydroxylase-like FAD-dependent oxidoreductase